MSQIVDNTEEFRCLSLCSGYAGIELGLERVVPNFRTVCYVEVEAFACANLVAKIEQGKLAKAPVWTDIKTFDGRPFRDRVHIVTAGYPCQGESVAGKRKGKADPRWLWPHIERTLEAVQPLWFFGENVSGHLTLGFPTVYRSLRNLGYSVEAGLFTAAECGAPHRRERLFILAYNEYRWTTQQKRSEQEQRKRIINCGKRMADSNGRRKTRQPQGIQKRKSCIIGNSELADTGKTEFQGWQGQQGNDGAKFTTITGSCDKWPARPGQPQYEWEESRVVAESDSRRSKRRSKNETEQSREMGKCAAQRKIRNAAMQGQAQSRLGGAASRNTNRVDRLRLLGNGVVPQCAELAFRTLIEKFDKDVSNKQICE